MFQEKGSSCFFSRSERGILIIASSKMILTLHAKISRSRCMPCQCHHFQTLEFGGLWVTVIMAELPFLWSKIARQSRYHALWTSQKPRSSHDHPSLKSRPQVMKSFVWIPPLDGSILKHEADGSVVLAEFPSFRLLYRLVPNNGWKDEQNGFSRRRAWDARILEFVKLPHKKPLIWCGDLNVGWVFMFQSSNLFRIEFCNLSECCVKLKLITHLCSNQWLKDFIPGSHNSTSDRIWNAFHLDLSLPVSPCFI